MRTNEQFKQEVITRAEVYKKVKKHKRKKYICSFAAFIICVIALTAAVPVISHNTKTESASKNVSSDSDLALTDTKGTANEASNYKESAEFPPGIQDKGNTSSVKIEYFAEIITDKTVSYTSDKDLVLAVYTAVNNASENADTEEAQHESVTDGDVYEISIGCAGEQSSYSFNGKAIKKGESDWIYISESAAKEIKAAIDKIM